MYVVVTDTQYFGGHFPSVPLAFLILLLYTCVHHLCMLFGQPKTFHILFNTAHIMYYDCRCILATDMAKHNDILKTFRAIIPTFDITAKDQKEIVSWLIHTHCQKCLQ